MTKKADNKHINKQQISLSNAVSPIDSKNIWILETWLHSETFEEFLQTFWDNKTNTIDILSRVMSKNKVNINSLWDMKIDINNIIRHNQASWLNVKHQSIISKIFLEKLWNIWYLNLWFRDMFELNFGGIKNITNKKLTFKDIQINITDIINKFPDIVNNVTISNEEIFEWFNSQGFNINPITTFDKQTPSDKKTLSELVYFETYDIIEKINNIKDKVDTDLSVLIDQTASPKDLIEDYAVKLKNSQYQSKDLENLNKLNEIDENKIIDLNKQLEESSFKDKDILNEIHNTNKNIWKNYINIFEEQNNNSEDIAFLEIIKKLVKNNFNFELLAEKEQIILVDKSLSKRLDKINNNSWVDWLKIDKNEYKTFLTKLMWFENKIERISITTPNGDEINFKISKGFKKGENLNLIDYTNFESIIDLPIIYDLEFEWNRKTIIDIHKILNNKKDLKYDDFNDEKIENLKKITLKWSEINKINTLFISSAIQDKEYENAEWNKNKQKETEQIESILKNNQIEYRWTKEWVSDAEEIFQDIDDKVLDDEELLIQADDMYNKLDSGWQNAFKNRLNELAEESDDIDVQSTVEYINNSLHWSDDLHDEYEEWWLEDKIEELTEEQKFMKEWEDLPWNKFDNVQNSWFINGTRLMINLWWSKLPPEDKDDSFFEIEIIDTESVKDKFQIKIIWNELKSDMEWQTMRFPKTEEHFSQMKKSGEIFKIAKWEPKNRKKCISNIKSSKIIKNMNIFGSGDGEISMKNGKFVNNNNEEIKYFCRSNDDYSGDLDEKGEKAIWQTKKYTTYKIEKINKSKWTVHVKCDFNWQDPDNLTENINYKYDKELSYEQFILLIESKKTRWYTKEQKDEIFPIEGPWRLPNKGWLRFRSIGGIIWAFKNGAKNIKDRLAKVNEEEVSDIENLLYSEEGLNLYGKIWNMFWAIWFNWTSEAFLAAKTEYYNDREWRTWKKIEVHMQKFEADPHFPSLWFNKLAPLLSTPWYVWKDKNRYVVAAGFLTLMKKDGPYWRWQWLAIMWDGFWVEKFLWPEHKARFKTFFEERKKQLDENKDPDNLDRSDERQDELTRLEFDYMSWIMDGRNPFWWSWTDWEDARASIRSREFVKKLDEWSQSYFGDYKKKVDDRSGKSFRQSEQEAYRMAWAWRVHKALPPLRQMVNSMNSASEKKRTKMTILSFMLSGLIKNGQDSSVMRDFEELSRTIWLLPGMRSRHIDQQDKIQKLLDWITDPKIVWDDWKPAFGDKCFSQAASYNKSEFEPWSYSKKQGKLPFITKDFPAYWNKYGDKILDILEFKDLDTPNSLITLAEKWWENANIYEEIIQFSRETSKWSISSGLRYTSPWTANKWIVSQLIPKKWKYTWSERVDEFMAKNFWKMVNSEINTDKMKNRWSVEFYLWKFINWFDDWILDQSSKTFIARGLPLVKKLKAAGHEKEAQYQLWYLIKWSLQRVLWAFPSEFGTTIDKFKDFFWNNIDSIDKNMIKNTLWEEEAKAFEDPYGMLSWNSFTTDIMNVDWSSSKEKTLYTKKHKSFSKNYINWGIDDMRKRISSAGASWWLPTPPETSVYVEHKDWYENKLLKS